MDDGYKGGLRKLDKDVHQERRDVVHSAAEPVDLVLPLLDHGVIFALVAGSLGRGHQEAALGFVVMQLELDFALELLVLVVELVDLLGEDVHIVVEGVVLLLALNEGVRDLLYVVDTRGLLDLSEGVLDHLHVLGVLVDEAHLLLVVGDDLLDPQLEQRGSVDVGRLLLSLGHVAGLVSPLLFQDFALEAVELVDVGLLLGVVLALELGDELLFLFGPHLDLANVVIELGGFFLNLLEQGLNLLVDFLVLRPLLAEHVDLALEVLVERLRFIEFKNGLLKLVLEVVDGVDLLLGLGECFGELDLTWAGKVPA